MRRIKFLVVLILGYATANAQLSTEKTFIDYNNIEMPVSPNAASLGTYGDTPVNLATGIPNISIPIYTLEVDGVNVPISLSYHASGIQVNELATAVGLKWTLNAGGGIFRSVSGKPDEDGWRQPFNDLGPLSDGFYDNFDVLNFNDQTSIIGSPPTYNGLAKLRDHNPDNYSYNFLGYSGKYITDFYNVAVKNYADKLFIDDRTIKDQMGNTYIFGENGYIETSNREFSYNSERTGASPIDNNGYSYDADIITGWMLTSIQTKHNKNIFFEYETYNIDELEFHPLSHTIAYGEECAHEGTNYAELTVTDVRNDYSVQLIKKISSDNVEILFDYSLEDPNLSTWKKKLTKITVNDILNGASKEFHFVYGSYDGDPRLRLDRVYEKKDMEELPGYSFSYIAGQLPDKYDFSQDFFGYYNGKNNGSLAPRERIIEDSYFPQFKTFYGAKTGDRKHDLNYLKIGVIESITYPTGGTTKFTFQPNAEYDSIFKDIKYCGGLRVSKTEDFDNDGQPLKTVNYTYDGLEGQSLQTNLEYIIKQVDGQYTMDKKTIIHSSFILPGDLNLSGYFYKNVTQTISKEGEVHKKESSFIEDISFGTLNSHLSTEKVYRGGNLAKIVAYEYGSYGAKSSIRWNILGDNICILFTNNKYLTAYFKGKGVTYSTKWAKLPNFIATTDILKMGSVNDTVTTIQEFDYDDETLLKVQEISDTQRTREEDPNGVVSYPVRNPNGERITIDYKYPFVPTDEGFDPEFPKGLMIRKEVTSDRHDVKIFGQAYEYDAVGNITKTYQYNKGAKTNNNALAYIPPDYEYISSFTYKDGKPVQMRRTNGQEVSYIWGYNGQFPVAKVEGVKRWTLEQINGGQLVNSIESTTDEVTLRGFLTQLREHASTSNGMVTTFTYEPLNGVKTITDPKGEKRTFEYDSFGRLVLVRDNDNNILSENEYNYGN
jgi:YD repeat-containing protein